MAQLSGQSVPSTGRTPLSDGLKDKTPLRVTEFQRDILGRLKQTLAHDNTGNTQETAYHYDLNGNLVRAANRHSITCFDYNAGGQLIGQHHWKVPTPEENTRNGLPETDWRDPQYDMLFLPQTKSIHYHYDFNGNRTTTVLPDGRSINHLYYGSGHLHQINLDGEVVSDIERDKLHREIQRTQGKLTSRYELDPVGRLKAQIAQLNGLSENGKAAVGAGYIPACIQSHQTAVKRSYGYDKTGNLIHSSDQRTGTTHFEYDKLGRITQAGNERFAFDPAHNILSDGFNAVTDNRIKHYNGISYYYDDLGNLIHRELADGEVQNYFYDLHDQLVKVEIFKPEQEKETWVYSYDALGRRTGKGRLKNNGEVSDGLEDKTDFTWDGSHLIQETRSDGLYTYIYTDKDAYEPLAQIRNWTNEEGESHQETNYFHCDQIGIPREMTDKDGNLLWFGKYKGWGKLEEETNISNAHQPFRLQNQYCDQETGLHYNFFRYYEPECGRFVNQDPIGIIASENLYAFAPNTQRWIDISGAMAQVAAGCAIGAPFGGPVGCAAGSTIALAATAVLAVGAAVATAMSQSRSKSTANSTSTTACSKCGTPQPKCPPDVYAKLNAEVGKFKALTQKLGGCKNGMGIHEIKKRMSAWKGEAIARGRREKHCWEGGDSGHGQAMTQAWNAYTNCKKLLP